MTWKEGSTIGWYSQINSKLRISARICYTSCYLGLSYEDTDDYFILSVSALAASADFRWEKK